MLRSLQAAEEQLNKGPRAVLHVRQPLQHGRARLPRLQRQRQEADEDVRRGRGLPLVLLPEERLGDRSHQGVLLQGHPARQVGDASTLIYNTIPITSI